jgi:hypothetical protein
MHQRVEQHRFDVCRSGLEEIAKEIQIVFRVSERARSWNELENTRQAIDKFQILRVTTFI